MKTASPGVSIVERKRAFDDWWASKLSSPTLHRLVLGLLQYGLVILTVFLFDRYYLSHVGGRQLTYNELTIIIVVGFFWIGMGIADLHKQMNRRFDEIEKRLKRLPGIERDDY